jgi:hypothetical protein
VKCELRMVAQPYVAHTGGYLLLEAPRESGECAQAPTPTASHYPGPQRSAQPTAASVSDPPKFTTGEAGAIRQPELKAKLEGSGRIKLRH